MRKYSRASGSTSSEAEINANATSAATPPSATSNRPKTAANANGRDSCKAMSRLSPRPNACDVNPLVPMRRKANTQ